MQVHYVGPKAALSLSVRRGDKKLRAAKVVSVFAKAYLKKYGEALGVSLRLSLSVDGSREIDASTDVSCEETLFIGPSKNKCFFPKRLRAVAYVGGSITAQREGWRPRFHAWLRQKTGATSIDAFCGNAGSTLLAFCAQDWVAKADAVVLEVAVNDGDAILEANGDETTVARALEGLIRSFRQEKKAVLIVDMFLRDDLPKTHLSGTRAWVDADDLREAAKTYQEKVPQLHRRIANHYGCGLIDLNETFKTIPREARDDIFRDDCHHTLRGAAFVAELVAEKLEALWATSQENDGALPEPLDPDFWRTSPAKQFTDFSFSESTLMPRSVADRCPLSGQPASWVWLHPGDEVSCKFYGRAFGLLTCVGPDTGSVVVEVDGQKTKVDLVDQWCYYWRTTIVMLYQGSLGDHRLRLTVDSQMPDRTKLKKPISDPRYLEEVGLSKTPKLWLMWYCVLS